MAEELLRVQDLRTCFTVRGKVVPAVDGISFSINSKESIGIVGESGCGKSVTSLSIIRLIYPPGEIETGEIYFEGTDLLKKSQSYMRNIRGNDIAMIFQEPMTSLNPVLDLKTQITETIIKHKEIKLKAATENAIELLRAVGIPNPEIRIKEYPHQLSGGMRQRAMIAMALSCNPKLLIADEPTTALDVTIQAQILELLKNLRKRFGMSIMIISHDLGVIAEMSDIVLVMYAGKIVEKGSIRDVLNTPLHPYTKGLLGSIPKIEQKAKKLHVIEGNVPVPGEFSTGCRFHPRCNYMKEICKNFEPPDRLLPDGRQLKCWIGTEKYDRGVAS